MDINTAIGASGMSLILAFQYMVAMVISVVTYPFALLHEVKPPRYFSLSMVLNVDNKPTEFNYVWHCNNKRFFTGNNKWTLTWEKSADVMVSKLPNNSVVIIPLPKSCDIQDGQEYIPNVSMVKNTNNPDEIDMYPGKGSSHDYGVSGIVQSGSIHVLDKAVPATTLSKENELLFKYISDHQKHYNSLIAVTYPKNEWNKYLGLENAEQFDELNKITSSTEFSNSQWFNRKKWADSNGGARDNSRRAYARTIPLRIKNLNEVNGIWRIENKVVSDTNIHMKRYDNLWKIRTGYRNVAPISIDYKGHLITLKKASEEVYDPETKSIIRFIIEENSIYDGGYWGLDSLH